MLRELLRAFVLVGVAVGGFCWLLVRFPATSNPFDELHPYVVDLDCSRDGAIRLWNVSTRSLLQTIDVGRIGPQ
ncbi:MAG: hypothetical protein ACT4QC_04295 [Planctomycetaceae bacterium]